MKKSIPLSEKLKGYSLLGAGIIASSAAAHAQVVHTDIIPDGPISYLDLNNDGINDFGFVIRGTSTSSGYSQHFRVYLTAAPGNSMDVVAGDYGFRISPELPWHSGSGFLGGWGIDVVPSGTYSRSYGPFAVNAKYLPLRITVGGKMNYGWLRLKIVKFISQVCYDYAYEETPDKSLYAGVIGCATFYQDADGDTYGSASDPGSYYCFNPGDGYSLNKADCDDNNPNVHPGASEVLNCIDDDCNGLIDEGTWVQKASLNVVRTNAVAFSIDGKGYLGTGDGPAKKAFWEYDPANNTWTQKAEIDEARSNAVGFSIGTKGYIGTGYDANGNLLNDFWEYDATTNVWTKKANFAGDARENAVGFSIGEKGYVGTGTNILTNYNDFWEYNPDTDTWTRKADFAGSARYSAVAFSIDSTGYIGTGRDSVNIFNDFWKYDATADTWTKMADFAGNARYGASAFSFGNSGYIGTGRNDTYLYHNLWQYDPATNTWIYKGDITDDGRAYAVGFAIGDAGYIGTGSDGNGSGYKDFYQYTVSPLANNRVYVDADNDGYGDVSKSIAFTGCPVPAGYVVDSSDCNDADANVHPFAKEICNGIDDNCDGVIDPVSTYYADADGDGYGDAGKKIDSCAIPGYVANSDDCNDADASIHPGAKEVCNNIDDNCNGKIDEGLKFTTYYQDADSDGYGNKLISDSTCNGAPPGYVLDSTDCDDTNPNANPGAPEIPNNGIDDNCNGQIDENSTGVNPVTNSASSLSVFPNPSNGNFIIELKLSNQLTDQVTIEVINELGQIVLSQNGEIIKGKLQQEIKLNDEPSGIYSVKVIAKNKVYTKQISLQK